MLDNLTTKERQYGNVKFGIIASDLWASTLCEKSLLMWGQNTKIMDVILQMWAALICEIEGREIDFGCVRPEETMLSHKFQTAALISEKENSIVKL